MNIEKYFRDKIIEKSKNLFPNRELNFDKLVVKIGKHSDIETNIAFVLYEQLKMPV